MVNYHITLGGNYVGSVDVPLTVRGLHATADFIAWELGRRFEKAELGTAENYHDGHIDNLTNYLIDLRDKLRARG